MPKPVKKTARRLAKKPIRRRLSEAELSRSILTKIARLKGTWNGQRVYLDGDEPTFIKPKEV